MGDKLGDATGFESAVDAVRANLRPGGPPVDYAALDLHVVGELDAATSRRVREHIVTYEAWNRAFWETQMAVSDEAIGSPERAASATIKDVDTDTVRAEIDRRLRPFTDGERAMSECDVVEIVKGTEAAIWSGQELGPEVRREFYQVAADYVDEFLTEYARKFENAEDETNQVRSEPSDTVSSGALETTFVTTSGEAQRSLRRQAELEKLKEAVPEAVQCFSLGRFVSDEEIAGWFETDASDVAKQRKFIGAKLAIAESRP